MSTRVTRAEARRRMAALQEPRPGQGWSETRPTRAPRRALERTRDEDSAPEPAVSSDSDVEVIGDPAVEEKEWRLRKAAAGGRIPRGTTDVGGAELPRSHSEEVCRATEETRKRFRDREPSDEEQQRGGGRGATAVGGTGGGFVGGATHHSRGRGAQPEERGWGRAMRAIPSAVVARDTTHSPLQGGVAHRRRSKRRRRSTVGHAAVEAGPATHAAIRGATTTGGVDAKRGVDRAADAATAGGGSPPGKGGGAVGGADGGAGRSREPQHTGVRGRGHAVAAADGDMDVARGARDRTDEGGAQDMGGGGTQVEPSGPPDEKPTGCDGPADTKHGPANTGDDGSDGGVGVAGEGTVGPPEPPAIQRPTLQRQYSNPGSTRPRPQFMRQVSEPEEISAKNTDMSTRVTRAEARRRMAALQEPRPGQGWSETRPTRAPRRALERTRDEDSAPEPAVSSDSDVEVIGDPAVEEKEWRLRKAAAGGRIPRGTTDVGGAELPRSHSEEVCRATEETRKRFRDREPSDEEQQRRRSKRRRRSTVGHAAVEAGPATHAAIRGATTTGGVDAKRGVDRAADAATAGGGSPPGKGGGAVGGADGGAGRSREPQHTGVRGRGHAVAAADGDMDVARGARDRTDEGGAQDMGGGGTQVEPSGPPDEKPTGCVGSADTKHGPANTGDDGSDGGVGVAGEGTVGVARATGHPKTDVAASSFEPRIDAPAAAVHAASFGPGRRRLAQGRQERVAGGN
nr:collagen alpha-2(I) chain-like [Drosophila suzukii]